MTRLNGTKILNRATLEHLEDGIVTSARTVSAEEWMTAIIDLAVEGGREWWVAGVAMLRLAESILDDCACMDHVTEQADTLEEYIAFAEKIGGLMVKSNVSEIREHLAECQTTEYWSFAEKIGGLMVDWSD